MANANLQSARKRPSRTGWMMLVNAASESVLFEVLRPSFSRPLELRRNLS